MKFKNGQLVKIKSKIRVSYKSVGMNSIMGKLSSSGAKSTIIECRKMGDGRTCYRLMCGWWWEEDWIEPCSVKIL